MIQEYFRKIVSALVASTWVKSFRLIRYDLLEIDEDEILVYRLRVTLSDGGLLELSERVVLSKKTGIFETTTYNFHWQNANNELIKRWDNAPHHPEVKTHPHHVHIGKQDNVFPCAPISASEIISLINQDFSTQ